MNHIASYAQVYALGHKAIADIFAEPVIIEEKIDGSQFSMCREITGELTIRSKGKDMLVDAPEKMFNHAVEIAKSLDLRPGWTYRCEYLSKPKHNTLAYDRIPAKHLIIFDISTGVETYLARGDKEGEAQRLGLEVVPLLWCGRVEKFEQLQTLLNTDSILGGQKIEGFVVKNYARFTVDKKVMVGKYVSEAFKEKHQTEWKKTSPTGADVIQHLITSLKTEARWRKAVQHLRDAGALTDSPKDIGALFKEVVADVQKEEADEIKELLFKHFWPQISRGITGGLPEWYKEQLAKSSLSNIDGNIDGFVPDPQFKDHVVNDLQAENNPRKIIDIQAE